MHSGTHQHAPGVPSSRDRTGQGRGGEGRERRAPNPEGGRDAALHCMHYEDAIQGVSVPLLH